MALVARRRELLADLATTIADEGTAVVVHADVTEQRQAVDAVERTLAELGRRV